LGKAAQRQQRQIISEASQSGSILQIRCAHVLRKKKAAGPKSLPRLFEAET